MEIRSFSGNLLDSDADVIVVSVGADQQLGPHAQVINQATNGVLQRLVDHEEILGKALECTLVPAPPGLSAKVLVVIGLGEDVTVGDAFRAAGTAVKKVTSKSRDQILFALDVDWDLAVCEAAVAGALVAAHGQDLYRAKKKRFPPNAFDWAGFTDDACFRGKVLGESINLTRRLVNTPAQDMYPQSFAEEAQRVADDTDVSVEIWDEQQLREQQCNALLAVARGSARPPRLVICRYRGTKDANPALALVGKGVTFDSGGLSLKPSDGMKTMKCDMAGAATVLGAIRAIAALRLPVHVIGVMGLVENMVSGDSYKLGDVLTARSGRTIEVLNTDAEGRLVLADALDVAVEQSPARMIDLATLTGACVVALGNDVTGAMTNTEAWCGEVLSAADHCGEYAWQLPMFPEFGEQIRSEIADIKNVGDGRWGGAITAAKLLEEFVSDVPWVHLDIAGPAYRDKQKPWMDAGASGAMVRTLVEVARRLANPA